MRFKELLRPDEHAFPVSKIKDRRRPGRNNQVSPHLIPLLRNPATVAIPGPQSGEADASPSQDDLAPSQGIFLSLALSIPLPDYA